MSDLHDLVDGDRIKITASLYVFPARSSIQPMAEGTFRHWHELQFGRGTMAIVDFDRDDEGNPAPGQKVWPRYMRRA